MKKDIIVVGMVALTLLSGCATYAENSATRSAAEQCAAMGRQFVKTHSKKTEAIVLASATVTGECVGPDDPRYVTSETSPEE